jgi:hypothetical protein
LKFLLRGTSEQMRCDRVLNSQKDMGND